MGQSVRFRRQASVNLNAFSQKFVQQIGRGMIYREIVLRLSGTLTYGAGANNLDTTLARGDEWSMIQRVDLVVNGTDIIRSFTGSQLRMIQRLQSGAIPRISATLGDGATTATAAPSVDSTCVINLWQFLSAKPLDTALDSSKISDLRLEITTNSSAGFQTANGPTAIALTLDVGSLESFGVDLQASDCKIYPIQVQAAGVNANLQVQLPVGPLYRGFFINAASSGAETATDDSTNISNVQLISGTTVFRDIPFRMLRDWQRQRLGWAREVVPFAANSSVVGRAAIYMRMARSTLHDEDAWTFLDLCSDGYLTEGIDSTGYSELFLNFNVTGGTPLITVLPVQIFPRRNAA